MAMAFGESAGGRSITIRTLDVGGDKPLPYLPQPAHVDCSAGSLVGRQRNRLRDSFLRRNIAYWHLACHAGARRAKTWPKASLGWLVAPRCRRLA